MTGIITLMIRARSQLPTSDKRLKAVLAAHGLSPERVFEASPQMFSVARGSSTLLREEIDAVFFIIGGALKLVAHVPPDREHILSFHFAGDIIFAPAGGSHVLSIAALEDSELLALDAKAQAALQNSEPRLSRFLCERAIRALGRSREKAVALGRKSASERVADFLISMATRIGLQQERVEMLVLPMSRRDIADSLGLTIETVSRQFGELRANGVIDTLGRSQVRILDLHALYARSGRGRVP